MANTKVTKSVLADDAVGLAQLDITNDPSDGQALTAVAVSDGYNLTWADNTVAGISSSADSTAITIDSSERVGINQSSPATRLHVYDNSAEIARFEGNDEYAYIGLRGSVGGVATSLGYFGFANDTGTAADLNITNAQNGDIAFRANSAEQMRITPTGVGIGTSSPSSKLHLESGNAHNKLSITSTASGGTGYDAVIDVLGSAANSEVQINMGINGDADREQIKTYQSAMIFRTNNSERMRMSSSGDLTIGTSTATSSFYNGANSEVGHGLNGTTGYAAHVRAGANTPLYVSHSGTGNGTYIHFYQSTTGRGFIDQSGGTTRYNASSDYRLKENVVDLENATSRLNSLRPVNFDWIESGENSDGFIAHEAQSIVPYAVAGTKDEVYTADNSLEEQEDLLGTPKYQAMDYGKLTPLLVKALQESNAKIEALEARVAELESN